MKLSRSYKVMLIGYAVIACLLFVSHDYNDFLITTRQSINLWTNLFNGDFLRFQSLNVCSSGNVYFPVEQGCAYNIMVYITFAIWNIPLALLEYFTSVDVMNNIFTILWAKSISLVFFAISVYLFWEIEKLINVEYKRSLLCLFLYSTSILSLTCVFQVGGYDILNVVLIMAAFKYYLEDKKVLYILFFGLSFCFKFFSILIVIPLYLIKEKRVYHVLLMIMLTTVPYFLTTIPFSSSAKDGIDFTVTYISNIIDNPFRFLFVFMYIIALVVAYKESNDKNYTSIFVCLISFASFFVVLGGNPYWIILISPFIYLLISKTNALKISIILEMFFGFFYTLNSMFIFYWVYFGETMRGMFIDRLFDRNYFVMSPINSIIESYGINKLFDPIIMSSIIILIIINRPKQTDGYDGCDDCSFDIMSFRFILSLICLLPILTAIKCW